MKTSGVNFTNIQRAPFMHADPKSEKKTVKLSSFIALLGFSRKKAACRMLVKLTPGVNFINVFMAAFTQTCPKSAKSCLI